MKTKILAFVRKIWNDQRGQTLPLAAIALTGILGMGGLTIDVGSMYTVRSQLQSSTNSAALAAAGSVWNSTSSASSASSVATNFLVTYYSKAFGVDFSDGAAHAVPTMGTVSAPTITTMCLNMLLASGSTCSSSTSKNAVRISQTATVTPLFMSIFGVKSIPVTTVATASMLGPAQPWNVAIILDATGSMSHTDTDCVVNNKTLTQFACATNGVQSMLGAISPCPSGTSSCTNSTSLFRVGLFIFPAVTTTTASYLYASSSSCKTPTWEIYPAPATTGSSVSTPTYTYNTTSKSNRNYGVTLSATYQIMLRATDADSYGFVSNYYSSSATNNLNSSSSLIKAISGCITPITSTNDSSASGLVSGGVTYHASVIYAAEQALMLEQASHSGSKNAIILLSDGQANLAKSTSQPMNLVDSTYWKSPTTSGLMASLSDTTGTYPSYINQCQQAIIAGQTVTAAGTRVYSVAYGAEQSGCGYIGSDKASYPAVDTFVMSTSFPSALNVSFSSASALTPCVNMENIASSLSYFYSDYLQNGTNTGSGDSSTKVDTSCIDTLHTTTSISDIFRSIAGTFTYPRLLPNDATGV